MNKEKNNKTLEYLVGDNPFHGISHLDQERAKARGASVTNPDQAAKIVKLALESGASGFMFSVSETTLGVLRALKQNKSDAPLRNHSLWAIAPYAYEYVRYAVEAGMSGLALRFAKQLARSFDVRSMYSALSGFTRSDINKLVQSLFRYELSRVRQASGKGGKVESLMMHEVITDMALALELDDLFTSYVDFVLNKKISPGFETRNFAFLVTKLRGWKIDLSNVTIAAPFNKIGFQMSPSREDCERVLATLETPNVIAMSILASGYLKLDEALDYVSKLPNLRGVVVGVSNEAQARETFLTASSRLSARKEAIPPTSSSSILSPDTAIRAPILQGNT